MTRAPDTLLAVRALLKQHARLPDVSLGIVGDAAHIGGYHQGEDKLYYEGKTLRDYSVVESPRDRAGLTLDAAAIDIGYFEIRVGDKIHTLWTFNTWLIRECRANAADTRDIREVIYSPDGRVVLRWDRLGIRSTGDGSHLTHTHISYHRDAIKAGRDLTPLYRRWLTEIGAIREDDTMAEVTQVSPAAQSQIAARVWSASWGAETAGGRLLEIRETAKATLAAVTGAANADRIVAEIRAQGDQTRAALLGQVRELAPGLAAAVVAHLGPEAAAGEIGEAIARELAAMLGAVGASAGQG